MAKTLISGTETLAKNIVKYTEGFLREVNIDMEKAELILKGKIKDNISNTDYTLEDLAKMGHPYARRSPKSIHNPDYIVHCQSGEMLSGLGSGTKKASVKGTTLEAEAYAGISDNVEHAKYVIYGTSKMVPRDFLKGSLEEVGQKILTTLKRSLNRVTMSFNGKEERL
jgi:hypothetical protein